MSLSKIGLNTPSHYVSFRGENVSNPINNDYSAKVDEEKSNAAKYMIGATALAGLVALGIAGYKGHLGKGIQEFLGGVEKKAAGSASTTTSSAGSSSAAAGASSATAAVEKYTAEEIAAMSDKKVAELSEEELHKLIASISSDEEPVYRMFIQKSVSAARAEGGAKTETRTVKKFVRQFPILRQLLDRGATPEEIAHTKYILGKDSPVLKKMSDLTMKDFIDISKYQGLGGAQLKQLESLNPEMKLTEFNETAHIFPKDIDLEKTILDNIEKIMA